MDKEAQVETGPRTAATYRDIADALRNRVDLFGKTLAGFATVGTGAVGLAKLGDLFPEDANPRGADIVLCVAGLLLAALAAITIAVMLMKAGDAAVVEVEKLGLSDAEKATVDPIFTATAQRFGLSTLSALDEKEISLRRASAQLPDGAARKAREARAVDMRTEIDLALARGQVAVVRNRATSAVSGTLARWCYALVAVGLVVFALAADASSKDRSIQIATAKACAEARTAGATEADLHGSGCAVGSPAKETPAELSPDVLRAGLVLRLGRLLTMCEQGAESQPKTADGSTVFGPQDCKAIKDAITAVLASSASR